MTAPRFVSQETERALERVPSAWAVRGPDGRLHGPTQPLSVLSGGTSRSFQASLGPCCHPSWDLPDCQQEAKGLNV